MVRKWVYLFDELDVASSQCQHDWDEVRGLLGGKGANLADMTQLGIPVPPGFTITSEACNAYLDAGAALPPGLWDQMVDAISTIERATGKKFGDAANPLLVSCRSGAKFSMPGMMDTVLNLGLNDEIVEYMITHGSDPRFVLDSYRRLIQMFGTVVLAIPDEPFQEVLADCRRTENLASDSELSATGLRGVVERFSTILTDRTGGPLPPDPMTQLSAATEAVFGSWNGRRARDYRKASKIPDTLGTAVNIQTMVFGNSGPNSATGVAVSRSATTGEPRIEGDYLINAQGEDVVAGIRKTNPIHDLSTIMPEQYDQLTAFARQLELHHRDMQDIEFTIDDGELWMLQTRNGKRTAQAAVRIAVDLVSEGTITKDEAIERVSPEQVEFFLHPQFEAEAKQRALDGGAYLTTGLNVSPGAAVGIIALDADLAEAWARDRHESVILVRPETKPDDVHGMLAAAGILTSSGGRTSHAALVARQFGRPAVVGASDVHVDLGERMMIVGHTTVNEGELISIDGTSGEVFVGRIDTKVPDIDDVWLMKLLEWADEVRRLGVWANADHPDDAERAVKLGATGIGLCRTEHMFFGTERLPIMQEMVMASNADERRSALTRLLPLQRRDFAGLFRAMDGYEVIIRLLDPPLHEFLPNRDRLADELTDLKIRLTKAGTLDEVNMLFAKAEEVERVLKRVEALRESNPMLGLRGVRLAVLSPEMPRMQIRAIFEAVSLVHDEGIVAKPSIMVPLTSVLGELTTLERVASDMAAIIRDEKGIDIDYRFGTMIETPRAALTAAELALTAEFFSFGTNDLTQMTFGISRDDAEQSFLLDYLESGILEANPFNTLDREGVGSLIRSAVEAGRRVRPDLHVGICGEHGGDPASIAIVDECGLDYVSCSPLRVPVARIAAAQSALRLARAAEESETA